METAKSLAATITGLEEYSGLSSSTETCSRLGNLHFIQEEVQKALEFYDRAIILIPGHLKAWFNKARTLEKLGRYEEAQQAYRSGDQLYPDPRALSSSLRNLSCVYATMGRPKEALEVLKRAISVQPFEAYSYYSASKVCESLGLQRKALEYINQFLDTANRLFSRERICSRRLAWAPPCVPAGTSGPSTRPYGVCVAGRGSTSARPVQAFPPWPRGHYALG
jgi:tetratricopeptide (TPR) repeat protein